MIFMPILTSRSLNVVIDQWLAASGKATVRRKLASLWGKARTCQSHRVVGEAATGQPFRRPLSLLLVVGQEARRTGGGYEGGDWVIGEILLGTRGYHYERSVVLPKNPKLGDCEGAP